MGKVKWIDCTVSMKPLFCRIREAMSRLAYLSSVIGCGEWMSILNGKYIKVRLFACHNLFKWPGNTYHLSELAGWIGHSAIAGHQCCWTENCFWPNWLLFEDEQFGDEYLSWFSRTNALHLWRGQSSQPILTHGWHPWTLTGYPVLKFCSKHNTTGTVLLFRWLRVKFIISYITYHYLNVFFCWLVINGLVILYFILDQRWGSHLNQISLILFVCLFYFVSYRWPGDCIFHCASKMEERRRRNKNDVPVCGEYYW